jgi:hypothetical protein
MESQENANHFDACKEGELLCHLCDPVSNIHVFQRAD